MRQSRPGSVKLTIGLLGEVYWLVPQEYGVHLPTVQATTTGTSQTHLSLSLVVDIEIRGRHPVRRFPCRSCSFCLRYDSRFSTTAAQPPTSYSRRREARSVTCPFIGEGSMEIYKAGKWPFTTPTFAPGTGKASPTIPTSPERVFCDTARQRDQQHPLTCVLPVTDTQVITCRVRCSNSDKGPTGRRRRPCEPFSIVSSPPLNTTAFEFTLQSNRHRSSIMCRVHTHPTHKPHAPVGGDQKRARRVHRF